MRLRPYQKEDHAMLASWWKAHGWDAVPECMIPPFAYVVEDTGGIGRAFACAYLDNGGTGVAMLEWIVTNPDNVPRESLKALDALLPFMRDTLRDEFDYRRVLAVCRQPALSRLLQKHHFQATDSGITLHLCVS